MSVPRETALEQVLASGGCRRVALTLLCLIGMLVLTLLLIFSAIPAWEGAGDPALHPLAVLVDPSHPGTIYVGTEQGVVMVSRDGGASWTTYHTGLPANTVVAALLVLPGGRQLLAGTSQGIFVSLDGGHTWATKGNGLPAMLTVDTLVAVTPDERTLLAGGTTGLYRSMDGGQTWSSITGFPAGSSVYGVDVVAGHVFAAVIPGGVYISTDSGVTWSVRWHGLPVNGNTFVVVHASPTQVYVGTSTGVFRSSDGGASWSASSSGLGSTNRVISLAVNPLHPEQLVAGTDTGVYRSADGGVIWSRLGGLPTPPGQSIGVVVLTHPTPGTTVYFAAADQLYRYPQAPNATKNIMQEIGIVVDLALVAGLVVVGVRSYRVPR